MDSATILLGLVTGTTPYHAEMRTFGMALEGAMKVRNGANQKGNLPWFYAYCLTVLTAFAGGLFGFLWMGKPSSLITGGDVTLTICAIVLVLTTYTPGNVGYRFASLFPVRVITTVWAQLFRALGTLAFINTATAEVSASKYYPTPILGPVLYGILLGNMGAFFSKGVHLHLEKGMPWPVENGLVVGLFYQLFANDHDGPVGQTLRAAVQSTGVQGSLDDKTFATIIVSLFMITTGVLMLPEVYGPSYYPFATLRSMIVPSELSAATEKENENEGTTKSSDKRNDTKQKES
mmetsp:Transcript_18086/g.49316  ORF Transcript_18086/g.49316 Transcript_18086/m.49316 type:complete len:291 (-) Transcript_18086:200-1072(-)